ncbi:MAG: IS21 family transposase [Actinomycetota bacterium]|nr:IS21 family transposase [Actinomycetota bacterium]
MKSEGEIVEILAAYDLTRSFRAAAALAGTDHHTVARYVARRDAGLPAEPRLDRDRLMDGFRDKLAELVEASNGHIRADVAHDKLAAMGYQGSARTTRRETAAAKRAFRSGQRRVFKPWIPEPGGWLQFDWGAGPAIAGRATSLFCAWLAWSRFRVVIACWDRTEPTLIACLDATFRTLGGAPTHVLTDNERTVTVGHVAGIAVRNPAIVAAGRYYGVSVQTCVVADPQSKGGSEATVRVAKADLVPTDANLRGDYNTFVDLQAACQVFTEQVNARPHRLLGRPPAEALTAERVHLHPVPALAHVATFGTTRTVSRDSTISVGGVRYSVPHRLIDTRVWVREHGDELVIVTVGEHGPVEAARHAKSTKGHPRILDAHYPPRSTAPAGKTPRARDAAEQAFLDLGDGARSWLIEAAASGAHRVRAKLVEALELARLVGAEPVDQALGVAALAGRFGDGDLAALLDHHRHNGQASALQPSGNASLQQGLSGWEALGR